ncbi:MAG: hypothetical protein ACE5FP_07885 [Gemmatimonadota bacterium]
MPLDPHTPAIRDETAESGPRRSWKPPLVEDLPPLTELTLSTGAPIPGDGDPGGGSTVF